MKMLAVFLAAVMILGIIPAGATPQSLVAGQVADVADIGAASGTVSLLRIHDIGTGYGPPGDELDVEVIVRLDSEPVRAFGFQLRDDAHRAVREGMLSLLRDAFNNDWTVTINYYSEPGRNNSFLFRVWVSK